MEMAVTSLEVDEKIERYTEQASKAGCPRDQIERFVQAGYIAWSTMLPFHAAVRQAHRDRITNMWRSTLGDKGKPALLLRQRNNRSRPSLHPAGNAKNGCGEYGKRMEFSDEAGGGRSNDGTVVLECQEKI